MRTQILSSIILIMTTKALTEFLPYTVSQKFVSLLLVESEPGVKKAVSILKKQGYVHLSAASLLEKRGNYYLMARDYSARELQDLLVQYGSGQISLHDSATGITSWINPAYTDSSLVLVITKEELEALEQQGVRLRLVTGLALQL